MLHYHSTADADSAGDRQDTAGGAEDIAAVVKAIERAEPPATAIQLALDAALRLGLAPRGIDGTKLVEAAAKRAEVKAEQVRAELTVARKRQKDTQTAERQAAQAKQRDQERVEKAKQREHEKATAQAEKKRKAERQAAQAKQRDQERVEKAKLEAKREREKAERQKQRGARIGALIEEFNGKYFVANDAGRAAIWQPTHDPMLRRTFYARSRVSDLRTLYSNRMVEVGTTKAGKPILRSAADVWLGHEDRKQYVEGVVFDPTGTSREGVFNLWQDFAVKPQPGSWDLMQRHIHEVLCSGNDAHFQHLLDWSANMIQHPGRQGEVAIVLGGEEGSGKGVFARAFLPIFGQHALHITNARHLIGHFNRHLRDCVFLFADEAFYAGDKAHVGIMKGLITEPYLTIEGKFENTIQSRNYLHLIISSNEPWIVPAAIGARRFFVLIVRDTYKNNHAYFAAIAKQMQSGGYEAMLYDLQHRDISKFNVRAVIVTEGLLAQKKLSLDTTYQWWSDVLYRGYVWASKLGLEDYFAKWHAVVTMDVLHSSYAEFARSRHERHPMSRERLGQFIVEVGGKATRPSSGVVGEHYEDVLNEYGGTTRKPDLVMQTRPHAYAVGSLTDAREAFDKATELKMNWPPDPATSIGAFIEEKCIVKADVGIRATALFDAWATWRAAMKCDPGSPDDFTRALKEAEPPVEIVQSPDEEGNIDYYRGIHLKPSMVPTAGRARRNLSM